METVYIETDENGVDWLVVEGILGTMKQRLSPIEKEETRFLFDDPIVFHRRFGIDYDKKLYGDMFTTPMV